VSRRDLYEVIGVLPSAAPVEIVSAYRRRLRDLHPDSGRDATADPAALTEVLAAFQVLRDPEQRAAYDAHRARCPSGEPLSGGVRIPVRHIDAEAPSSTSVWLRAGPARLDPEAPMGSRPVPSPDLFRLFEELIRRWR